MTKRYLVAEIGSTTKQSKKEQLTYPRNHFINTLDVLTYINKEVAHIVKEQVTPKNTATLKNIFGQMTTSDKKEYTRFKRWISLPPEKRQKFTTDSQLLAKLVFTNLELDISHHRFHRFCREMSVVYLIVEFEEFLDNLLNVVFAIKPQILKSHDMKVTFSDILAAENMNSLIDDMRSKAVKKIIKWDIDDIFKYLEKQFKINLTEDKNYRKFKERFYRRHILIHNNLYPDEHYKSKTGYVGKYTRLQITDFYLKQSISLYKKYATVITDQLIAKFG